MPTLPGWARGSLGSRPVTQKGSAHSPFTGGKPRRRESQHPPRGPMASHLVFRLVAFGVWGPGQGLSDGPRRGDARAHPPASPPSRPGRASASGPAQGAPDPGPALAGALAGARRGRGGGAGGDAAARGRRRPSLRPWTRGEQRRSGRLGGRSRRRPERSAERRRTFGLGALQPPNLTAFLERVFPAPLGVKTSKTRPGVFARLWPVPVPGRPSPRQPPVPSGGCLQAAVLALLHSLDF